MSANDQSRPDDVLDEAEAMIWALLDDQLDDDNVARLSKLIEEHDAVRSRYVSCVQLHVDLEQHFGAKAAEDARDKSSPVLPNLLPGFLPSQSLPPVAD